MGGQILYKFPRTLNIRLWEEYLGRNITYEEHSLIESVRDERNYNRDLDMLFEITKKKGLYIPKLTARNGNCLFESLTILGLCENLDDFRKFLAHMMYFFKDKKNFFSYDSRSLVEMFNDTNEIEYVLCHEDYKIYKYTYETMCQDFASGFSWTRLPTQLIIQFISALMNVRFEICSNTSEYVNVLDVNPPNANPHVIYLGHLNEKHYVPLQIRTGKEEENVCPKYNGAKVIFFQWAIAMERSINELLMGGCHTEDEKLYRNPSKVNTESYVEITTPVNDSNKRVEYDGE